MRKTMFSMYAALALTAACALTLAGCPTDPDPEPDPALIGSWTNKVDGLHDGLVKEFTIKDDFSFTASINPTFIGAYIQGGVTALTGLGSQNITDEATRWTVTGKLTAEGDGIYIMSSLTETTGKPVPGQTEPAGGAATVVAGFNGPVKITFTKADKTAFKFESAASGVIAEQVTAFFGGNYTNITID
jgi:hypothetical protein